MKLAELGEFGFIERIRQAVIDAPGVRRGIGDDCAVLELPPGHLLLTSKDLLIEDVHFRLGWTDWRTLGRKSVAVNVSDVAAMGGTPRHLYLGLGIPAGTAVDDLEKYLEGFLEAAGEYGAILVGGDTCRSPGPLLISVTVEGSALAEEVVCRNGARPGDAIYVSGTLGDSALGLRCLLSGEKAFGFSLGRHLDPRARVALGRALAARGLASAMIDLSDGLCGDLKHILSASDVGARLEKGSLPLSSEFREALATEPELLELAWCGGEDYELLFTVPREKEPLMKDLAAALELPLTCIGRITEKEEGFFFIDTQGHFHPPQTGGFNHFRTEV
ncbi:MAG: thiamine-phosphate kinase [Syntrophotaleaceae bacterium]